MKPQRFSTNIMKQEIADIHAAQLLAGKEALKAKNAN